MLKSKTKRIFRFLTFTAACALLGGKASYASSNITHGWSAMVEAGCEDTYCVGSTTNVSGVSGRYVTVLMDVYDGNGNHVKREQDAGIDSVTVKYYGNITKDYKAQSYGSVYWGNTEDSGVLESLNATNVKY